MDSNIQRVIIAGDRRLNDYDFLREKCDEVLSERIASGRVVIVSGHARGTDLLGERYASEHSLQCELFPADWKKFGKSAGPIRNREMATHADALIAFYDGKSKGTGNMIRFARDFGLEVNIVNIGNMNTNGYIPKL